ncbi:hypothetical protein [Streptomyces sp. NPDC059398]|uniref:nucleotidyltransferase domain-containing protein n=1 Tax=Streptomyces sp. NPDC059398 TaxID=3346820 RepID=UPI0036887BC3
MDLDPARRAAFAQELQRALMAQCAGSVAALRGSLARGTSDPYSDIDIAWMVPSAQFDTCVAAVERCLGAVRAVVSLRSDPDVRRSCGRRLLFLAFRDMPLFWRLDLEITTLSSEPAEPAEPAELAGTAGTVNRVGVAGPVSRVSPAGPAGGSSPRGQVQAQISGDGASAGLGDPEWSLATSALANAVAVVKAVLRGQPEVAAGLLKRGLSRVGAGGPASGRWRADVIRLADAAACHEPAQRPLADQIKRLAAELLPE